MTMYGEVDVFISNYTLVDPEIYQLWIDGHCGKRKKSAKNSTKSVVLQRAKPSRY